MYTSFSSFLSCGVLFIAATGPLHAQDLPPLTKDDLVFSVENMDTSVDPTVDFYRYASGNWLDRVTRPEDMPSWGIFDIMGERVVKQVAGVAAEAAGEASDAPKGSPAQLVGDFYSAFMDVDAIQAAGMSPLQEEFDAIDAISSFDDMTRFMAEQARVGGPSLFNAIGPGPDPTDNTRYALYIGGQTFGLTRLFLPVLAAPELDPRKQAYRAYVTEVMQIAGYDPYEAARIADLTIDIETALYAGFLTPEEGNNPANRYSTLSFEEAQALNPAMDIGLYLDTIGMARAGAFYMFEPRSLQAQAEVWNTTPMEDLKDYARFRVIDNFKLFLDPAFREPDLALSRALLGSAVDRPRTEQVTALLTENLGHPASQLYVEKYFSEKTRVDVLEIVKRVHQEFGKRIETRDWLSEDTRKEALEKHAAMVFKVGYPDTWIDFSSVDIGHDPVANIMNLGTFDVDRTIEKMKHPVVNDEFSDKATLPTSINAGYLPSANRFEVSAAITQQPIYADGMDPALKFCRLGAVSGHEMTHGFDSGGRQYDAAGNFRDWWTPEDAAAFEAEAQKLIDQAEAYEALPGLHLNGPLNVKENMADVGGITFAHLALMTYLKEHPEENVEIDGLTQEQRCFVAWAQFWTMHAADGFVRTIISADFHPPNFYRATAALRHLDAFYEAFGIEEGDPMWLPPEKRVNAW